jgi:uncharacterized protein (TIGR03067 family)
MRHFGLALLAAFCGPAISSGFAPAPVYKEPPKPKVPELVAALQGTWEVDNNQVMIRGGARLGGRVMMRRQVYIRIHDNLWSYVYSTNGVEREGVKYEMILDPKQTPATLDLRHHNNANGPGGNGAQGAAMQGIVKVEGNTLTFCYSYGGNAERPRNFEANGNQVVWKGGVATSFNTMTLKKVK